MNRKAKGSAKERQSKALFESEGWYVTKAGASLGVADLVALKQGERPRLIQVKCSDRPYHNFGPAERGELRDVAKAAGATPELAWWPPRARTHILFDESEWPDALAA